MVFCVVVYKHVRLLHCLMTKLIDTCFSWKKIQPFSHDSHVFTERRSSIRTALLWPPHEIWQIIKVQQLLSILSNLAQVTNYTKEMRGKAAEVAEEVKATLF